MGVATELLRTSWEQSAHRLARRCQGLTDAEYLWAPTSDAWTIRPDPDRPGRWTYDYDFEPPPPAPVTSISWRLVHIIADNEIYWEYAFGPRERTFPISTSRVQPVQPCRPGTQSSVHHRLAAYRDRRRSHRGSTPSPR